MQLYIFALKYNMNLNEVPKVWLDVQKAIRYSDPEHVIKVPGYVKLIMEHGTKWTQ
ncbi:hypothetical protein LCGC14_1364830 [marine sediment metagenome]|uniref:Uncharacterized protein n=1 Tax=marine sediment metagenome TaxID=412755 RepID=A0A0F9K7J9_9ZZZZ